MPLMRSRILFHPVRSDEVNRFAYVPKDWADELSSQHRVFNGDVCNDQFLEIETLGPLVELAPGDAVEHLETWHLLDRVAEPKSDKEIEKHLLP